MILFHISSSFYKSTKVQLLSHWPKMSWLNLICSVMNVRGWKIKKPKQEVIFLMLIHLKTPRMKLRNKRRMVSQAATQRVNYLMKLTILCRQWTIKKKSRWLKSQELQWALKSLVNIIWRPLLNLKSFRRAKLLFRKLKVDCKEPLCSWVLTIMIFKLLLMLWMRRILMLEM